MRFQTTEQDSRASPLRVYGSVNVQSTPFRGCAIDRAWAWEDVSCPRRDQSRGYEKRCNEKKQEEIYGSSTKITQRNFSSARGGTYFSPNIRNFSPLCQTWCQHGGA